MRLLFSSSNEGQPRNVQKMQTHGQHARRRRQYTTSQVFSFMRVVDILLCCSFRLLQGEYGTAPRVTLWNVFNVAQDGALLTYLNTSSLSGKREEKKRRRKKGGKKNKPSVIYITCKCQLCTVDSNSVSTSCAMGGQERGFWWYRTYDAVEKPRHVGFIFFSPLSSWTSDSSFWGRKEKKNCKR